MNRETTGKFTQPPPAGDWKKRFEELQIESVIADERTFKAQLGTGEDAYLVLRVRNIVQEVWDVGGVVITGGTVAASPVVAATFFPAGGLLGMLGIASAATPVGWVIGAGALSGLAWVGIKRLSRGYTEDWVEVVPKYIKSGVDILGLALFDLMAPLAIRMALVDGEIHDAERRKIKEYLTRTWGYHPDFVEEGVACVEEDISRFEIEDLARDLAEFSRKNRDCNYDVVTKKMAGFLQELVEADGKYDPNEVIALEAIRGVFKKRRPVWPIT